MVQIKETVQILNDIVNCLLGEEESKGYNMLVEVVPKLTEISEYFIKQEGKNVLIDGLTSVLEGLENKDKWMIADVIKYEIVEVLNKYN